MQETVVFLSPRKQKKQAFEETKNMQIVKDTDTAISYTVWLKELKTQCKKFKASRESERNPTVCREHCDFLT